MRRAVRVALYVGLALGRRRDRRERVRGLDDPPVVPAARGAAGRARADEPGRRAPRRARDPDGVRRHAGRLVLRSGIRARPGPVLGDGLPPARHVGPPRRVVRPGPGGHRRVHPHDGLAPGRAAGTAAAGPGDAAQPPVVRRRGERLPRPALRGDAVVRALAARRRRTGRRRRRSGRRSTRSPGSRRWPGTCAATCRPRPSGPGSPPSSTPSSSPSSTPTTRTTGTHRSSPGARSATRVVPGQRGGRQRPGQPVGPTARAARPGAPLAMTAAITPRRRAHDRCSTACSGRPAAASGRTRGW